MDNSRDDAASRCRAQGGNTSDETGSHLARQPKAEQPVIKPWDERANETTPHAVMMAMESEIADLRAALTAGAAKGGADIGKSDKSAAQNAEAIRNAAHPELTPMFLLNAALCIEEEHSVPQHKKDAIVEKLGRIADEIRALQSGTATTKTGGAK